VGGGLLCSGSLILLPSLLPVVDVSVAACKRYLSQAVTQLCQPGTGSYRSWSNSSSRPTFCEYRGLRRTPRQARLRGNGDSSQILGRSHYDVFPDLPERWKEVHRRGLEGETLRADEDRWDRKVGTTMWVRWEIRPWRTPNGIIGGLLIFAEDITHRKQMEDALSGMSRKLIQSQEQERARIGRELHDDINQRLAMLVIELEHLQDNPSEVRSRVQDLRKETTELSNDVQALSHELHSSKLEHLGVVAGMKSWCKEFGERQRMEVDFRSEAPSPLPFEIGLSLFRVLQEALHNAVKHSRVKRVEIQMVESSNEVHLIVSDAGTGFDVEAARQSRGLGLTSMQERVRLVNGKHQH
jgi:signal transduction histidine kinase